jgi:hypothetical protein
MLRSRQQRRNTLEEKRKKKWHSPTEIRAFIDRNYDGLGAYELSIGMMGHIYRINLIDQFGVMHALRHTVDELNTF